MKIRIHDFEVPVRLGCTAEERAYPQIVRFQLELTLGSAKSLDSDALEDTVDYMAVIAVVEKLAEANEFKLLEHLAKRSGEAILELSSVVFKVSIQVKKHIAPQTSGISFQLELSR